MSAWKSLLGRISVFPVLPAGERLPSALDLFKAIWKSDPNSFQQHVPTPGPFPAATAQGLRNEITVSCSVSPSRVDLNFLPNQQPSQTPVFELPMIGNTKKLKEEIELAITALATESPAAEASRIAVFAQFALAAPNFAEANKAISSVLPDSTKVQFTDENEEDFIFQINRPRSSESVEGSRLNLLTKWAVERVQLFNIAAPSVPGSTTSPGPPFVNEFIVPSVSFDNNNAPRRPLSRQEQSALLAEALGHMSATQKDIGLNLEGF
jgi:hypothetical protein